MTAPTCLPAFYNRRCHLPTGTAERHVLPPQPPQLTDESLLARQHPADSCNSSLSGEEGGVGIPFFRVLVLRAVWVKGLLHKALRDLFVSLLFQLKIKDQKSQSSVN